MLRVSLQIPDAGLCPAANAPRTLGRIKDRVENLLQLSSCSKWNPLSNWLSRILSIDQLSDRRRSFDMVPFRTTKESCQKDLDTILDTVLAVLGRVCSDTGPASDLQADIATSKARLESIASKCSRLQRKYHKLR